MKLKEFIKSKAYPITLRVSVIIYLIIALPILFLKEGE